MSQKARRYQRIIARGCRRKTRYADPEAAKYGIQRCLEYRPHVRLTWYPCDFCSGYHLTSQIAAPDEDESD